MTETTRKLDYEELVGAVRPFAEQCLRRYRQFVPFGATVNLDGEVALVAGWEGSEEPDAVEVMELLLAGYREGARNGQCRATALVYDILTLPPGKAQKQDAIAIALNHRDGEPTALVIPYSFDGDELVVEEPYARQAQIRVFE